MVEEKVGEGKDGPPLGRAGTKGKKTKRRGRETLQSTEVG